MIYRLVTANTIDQKIVERAAAKRRLEKMIIHSKKFKSQDSNGLKRTMEAISPQELLELLNSDDATGFVDRADESGATVLTDDQLELLLDRSDLTWKAQKKLVSNTKRKKLTATGSHCVFQIIEDEDAAQAGGLPSINK
jgi:ATP-dependent DNA helicase